MKVVIIEDEPLAARDLAACIVAAEPSAEIVAMLSSIGEATAYFGANAAPDIIFSDIQLGDGLSFSIFEGFTQVVPVIFCTAYDEYALDAFRAAGIDYILKPFTAASIAAALGKYNAFRSRWTGAVPSYSALLGIFGASGAPTPGALGAMSGDRVFGETFGTDPGKRSILVFYKEKIMPVAIADIVLFYLPNDAVRLMTFNKQQYSVNKNLEELEKTCGRLFYRVNRQYLVNREAIRDVAQDAGRKLQVNLVVPFEEKITVSRLKVNHFLGWLEGG